MGTFELPLIIFTVLGETSVGMILALWWLSRDKPLDSMLRKKLILLSGGFLTIALLASLFHLGHPELAYRALSHLSTSWLSREIVFFLLTFVAWAYLFLQSRQSNGNTQMAAAVTAALGILGIISSAMIYVLPKVPAWDNVGPIFFFLLTSLLLGALATLAIGGKTLSPTQNKGLLHLVLASIITSILVIIFYLSFLGTSSEGTATAQFILSSPLFWVRIVLNWLIPLFVVGYIVKKEKFVNSNSLLALFLLTGIGEFLGRTLFYLSAVGIHITALH